MDILEGLVLMNDTDIWKEFGAFLAEEKRGAMDNLNEILRPSKVKGHVGVDFREEGGVRYSDWLEVRNEERDVTLTFGLVARSRDVWMEKYLEFVTFLKNEADGGWIDVVMTELKGVDGKPLRMRWYYVEAEKPKLLSCLWKEGRQAGRFKVRFREPEPKW